jgi:hypothetical protein
LLPGCGLSSETADVRGPAVSWDAQRLAFAARSAVSEPLRIYEARADGSECAPLAGIAAAQSQQNGILTHDFDPAYAPDGQTVIGRVPSGGCAMRTCKPGAEAVETGQDRRRRPITGRPLFDLGPFLAARRLRGTAYVLLLAEG